MYKWNPEEYRTSSSNQKRWGIDLLSHPSLEGYEDVLDIGCGDGKDAEELDFNEEPVKAP